MATPHGGLQGRFHYSTSQASREAKGKSGHSPPQTPACTTPLQLTPSPSTATPAPQVHYLHQDGQDQAGKKTTKTTQRKHSGFPIFAVTDQDRRKPASSWNVPPTQFSNTRPERLTPAATASWTTAARRTCLKDRVFLLEKQQTKTIPMNLKITFPFLLSNPNLGAGQLKFWLKPKNYINGKATGSAAMSRER